jgi:HAE1 family hydrophobic/amphiphilic exporter-1
MGLPAFSVKKPVLTLMVFAAVLVLGVISLSRLQVELYQGQARGIISILIRVRGGLAPAEVEKLVTKPVEESVATISHLRNLYSNSREGESRVTMEFEPGTDMNFAALEVREKFSKALPKLPTEIEKPVIANYSETESAILILSVTSKSKSPEEIREIVDNEMKPVLARVNGVASIEVYGGRERKILVELDRDKMYAYNISIERVMDIIGAANLDLLAGTVEKETQELSIRAMGGFRTVDEIGDIGVATTPQGSIISLREIATVKDSYLEPQDYARLNLTQTVSIQVKKASDSNTIRVSKDVQTALRYYQERSKEDLQFSTISDHAKSIQKAIDDVVEALYQGIILTTLMIYLFLRRLKISLLIFISIPTSIVTTFIFMSIMGISINVMTLTGLAMAVGNLVDSTIVVLENMFKKVEEGEAPRKAIVTGSEEMWLVLLASTATNVAVFLPILFIDKEIQLIYQGLAFTVTVTLFASLYVALALVPVLSNRFNLIDRGTATTGASEERQRGLAYGTYRRILTESFKMKYPLLLIVFFLFLLCARGLMKMDIDLPSTLEENEFGIIIFPIAGADLSANDQVAKKIEELLREFPEIETMSTVVRKDDLKVFVRLIPRKQRKTSKDALMEFVREKGKEVIKEVHEDYSLIVDEGISSDESRKIIVNIFGHENDKLEELAHDVAQRMGKVPGISNIVMTDLRKRPEYDLIVDRGRAAYYGISVKDVADSVHAQVRGMRPTKYHEAEKGREIETITRLQAIYRQKIEDLLKIFVMSPATRQQVPIEQIASFHPSFGPNTIDRKDKYRYVFVKADTNRALETTARMVKEALEGTKFPQDYFYRFGGKYPELIKSKGQLSYAVLLTMLLIYMILACLFQSYLQPLIIMVAVPLAAIGIYASLKLTGKTLSEHVFIGMITLAGTVVNNSTVMIDRYNSLKPRIQDRYELLIRCGEDRLRPIFMTTLTSILAFMPMAIGIGQSSDLWAPLAITTMGGLISSTILTLIIIPNIFLVIDEFKQLIASLKAAIQALLTRLRILPT